MTVPIISIRWRFETGFSIEVEAGALYLNQIEQERIELGPRAASISGVLLRLMDGLTEEQLEAAVERVEDRAFAHHYLNMFRRAGCLVAELWADRELIAILRPKYRDFNPSVPKNATDRARLSRFAYLRNVDGGFVLECSESPCTLEIKSPVLSVLIHKSVQALVLDMNSLEGQFLAILLENGFMVDPDVEESRHQKTWEFHDRNFQHQSRQFDDFGSSGGTYRFKEGFESLPAIRPAYPGETVDLPHPSKSTGKNLVEAMESRRSRRQMDQPPVNVTQIGELFYRVARIIQVAKQPLQDTLKRNFPSGGAIHELEFYLAVRECDGLAPGFYHYRGDVHAMTLLDGAKPQADEMLSHAAGAWGQRDQPPQCLVVMSSRFPRIAWKYEAIAYRVSLMNAGAAIQSLYLVCTDMDLNCSAVGNGRPGSFAQATGNSTWEEASIAEFGFGSSGELT